jgi:hypothetical protein
MYQVTDSCCWLWAEKVAKKQLTSAAMCAPAIRALWRAGGHDERAIIATRIAVWRNMGKDRIALTQGRILARELHLRPTP